MSFVTYSGTFPDAVVLFIMNIIVSHSQARFHIPMIVQHPMVAATDAAPYKPPFIPVLLQVREYTERQLFPTDIELRSIEIESPEQAVKLLASPIFVFGLNHPITVHVHLAPFPWSQASCQFDGAFIPYGIRDSGSESSVNGGKRVESDGYFLS